MIPHPISPAETLVDGYFPPEFSTGRKIALLLTFCLAQFLDAINASALFSAVPSMVVSLGLSQSETTWIFSAFQLTFASFLLVSGRISDVYSPKTAFITGVFGLGVISLGSGFVRNKIILIVLRAVIGIAASLTIPSALKLIVRVFPESREQARAIGLFGGCGAIGNILGLVLGAIIVEYLSWPWVFYVSAMVAIPVAIACIFLIPADALKHESQKQSAATKLKSLDLIGVTLLTVALVLIIFAVTSGSTSSWASAEVLAPLLIAIGLIGAFLYWETLAHADVAAVPPKTWFYPNFAVLFGTALLPYFWWTTLFLILTTLWQSVYNWPVVSSAVHMIPIGVMAFAVSFSGPLARHVSPKWIILSGQTLMIISTILLTFADGPEKYWSICFPALVLGSGGTMLVFTHTNIAIFRTTPSSQAGTVGAIFNGALQLGSAVGIAAVNSIETAVEARKGGFYGYAGRKAAFFFVLGIVCLEAMSIAVFYRVGKLGQDETTSTDIAVLTKEPTTQLQDEKGTLDDATPADGRSEIYVV